MNDLNDTFEVCTGIRKTGSKWNVWYKARLEHDVKGSWTQAPHLIEEVYNLEDALVVAQWMNVFLRKSDVLKIACLAQIVNVIAPILTTKDAMLKQSIYYPIMLFNNLASRTALDVAVRAPYYETKQFGDMPLLDVSASYDEATGAHAVFIVNRSQTDSVQLDMTWQDLKPTSIKSAHQLAGTDPKAANSYDNPNQVVSVPIAVPEVNGDSATMVLPPMSFTALELSL